MLSLLCLNQAGSSKEVPTETAVQTLPGLKLAPAALSGQEQLAWLDIGPLTATSKTILDSQITAPRQEALALQKADKIRQGDLMGWMIEFLEVDFR